MSAGRDAGRTVLLMALAAAGAGLFAHFLGVAIVPWSLASALLVALWSVMVSSLSRKVATSAEVARVAEARDQAQARFDQLRDAAERAMARLPEGLVVVDDAGRVRIANQRARQFLALPAGVLEGRLLGELSPVDGIRDQLAGALAERTPQTFEIQRTAHPRDQVLECRILPENGPDGGATVVLADIADVRRLDSVRRDFVANVSHELKTPLTAIRGAVLTILDDPEMPDAERRRFMGMIRDHAERLTMLVTDLLTLSRIEAEDATIDLQPIDVREPIRDCLGRLRQLADSKSVQLQAELPDKSASAPADREALVEVLDNLVSNGIQYNRPGGRVTTRVRDEGDAVMVEVEDTGIGIEAQHLDRIFERFYRVDKARSRAVGGTGLGLSIVKHMVQAMGGTVGVRSNPGSGTLFWFRLPHAT